MHIELKDIVIFFLSFFGGGGLGLLSVKLFIQQQAKAALKEDLESIIKSISELKKEVNQSIKSISSDYVSNNFCKMQHNNLDKLLENMDHKLDIVLEKL